MMFWLACGALIVAAYAFLLPTLLGKHSVVSTDRDQLNLEIYRQRRGEIETEYLNDNEMRDLLLTELERELLSDIPVAPATKTSAPKSSTQPPVASHSPRAWITAGTIAIVLPLFAFSVYSHLGRYDRISGVSSIPSSAQATAPDMESAIAELAAHLEQTPDDLAGWRLLARSYMQIGKLKDARETFARAYAMAPVNLELKAEYAEFLGELNNGKLAGDPERLINEILERDPDHLVGLWLAGMVAAETGDIERARGHWEKLRGSLPDGDPRSEIVSKFITRLTGAVPSAAPSTAETSTSETTVNNQITVAVSLHDTLSANPNNTLYIFARAAEGPKMPLAIARLQAGDLPVTVTLDDSMGIIPTMTLSNAAHIVIGARISNTGDARPATGDLEGLSAPIKYENGGRYAIEINRTIP